MGKLKRGGVFFDFLENVGSDARTGGKAAINGKQLQQDMIRNATVHS
jgi:hypothetical protein